MTFEHVFCILSMGTQILTPSVVLPKYLGNEHFRRLGIECFQFVSREFYCRNFLSVIKEIKQIFYLKIWVSESLPSRC